MNSVQAVYGKIDDPIKAAREVGIWLSRAGLIGPNATAEAGAAIAFDAFARGVPIFDIPLTYHLVSGRLTMKAEAMLAGWHEIGGKHRIVERSADACRIEFSIDDEVETFATTWEEAQTEKWPYGKDGKSIKDTWKGAVGRADMLWARTISRGVRKLRPAVVGGKYTPEEIADLAEYTEAVNGNGSGSRPAILDAKMDAKLAESTKPVAMLPPSTAPIYAEPSIDGYATATQSATIRDLFDQLGVPVDAQEKALSKRGVKSTRSLTTEQAVELIASLEAAEQSKLPDNLKGCPTSAPCDQSQVERIITIIKEITEHEPDFPDRYKARLVELGKQRTADLSMREADAVLAAFMQRNMRHFFDKSLSQLADDNAATTEPPPN